MSTIKSSAENLTLNADGANNDIKFQSNGSEVAAIDQAGNLTLSGTVDGVDIQTLNTTASAALPKSGGTMTGNLDVTGSVPTIKIKGTVNDSANSGKIEFKENDNTNGFDLRYDGSANNFVINSNQAANALVIARTTGKVGIGTAAPAEMLHIESAQNSTKLRIKNTKSGETVGAELEMTNEDGTWQLGTGRGSLHDGTDTDFHIYGNGTRMWIKRSNGSAYFANNIHADGGISFNGETDAAHLLDDYEQGTWTPAIAGTTGSFNISGTSNYTKIGNLVTVNSYIYNGTNIGNTAAEWDFTGLPYTPIRDAICAVRFHNVNIPSDVKYCVVAIQTGSSGIEVWGVRDAASMDILQWSDIGGGHVEFTCTYCSTS